MQTCQNLDCSTDARNRFGTQRDPRERQYPHNHAGNKVCQRCKMPLLLFKLQIDELDSMKGVLQ